MLSWLVKLTACSLILLLSGYGVEKISIYQNPIHVDDREFVLPLAAKFFPRHSAFTIHWLIDPNKLPKYVEEIAPANHKKLALNEAKQIRNGAFALAGLDFDKELSDWVGPEISLAIFTPTSEKGALGWVMALSSKKKNGAAIFLEHFWQVRGLAGSKLQTNSYRGIGLISEKRNTDAKNSQALATALINDDLLLIASERSFLQEALDVSQLTDDNQLEDQELEILIKQLDKGNALITASPSILHSWLGFPERLLRRKDINGLVATLQTNSSGISLDGALLFNTSLKEFVEPEIENLPMLKSHSKSIEGLATLNSPYKLLEKTNESPLSQWIGPVINKQLDINQSSGLKTILSSSKGPLLWIQDKHGWVLGTNEDSPRLEDINKVYLEKNFTKSDLISNKKELQIWSKLVIKEKNNYDSLESEVPLILLQEEQTNWWSRTIESLSDQDAGNESNDLEERLEKLHKINGKKLSNQLALNENLSQKELEKWQPWILLQSLAGRKLNTTIKGLVIALGNDENINNSSLHLRAILNTR